MVTQLLLLLFYDSRMDALSQKIITIFTSNALSLMFSIGHRTRLFNVSSLLLPASNEQVANAAGLQKRYAQEWLNLTVVVKILDHSSSDRTYYWPPEYTVLMNRGVSPINMAAIAQYIYSSASLS